MISYSSKGLAVCQVTLPSFSAKLTKLWHVIEGITTDEHHYSPAKSHQ